MQNNQGRVRGYQPKRLITLTETLIILDITVKTELIIVLLYTERKKNVMFLLLH